MSEYICRESALEAVCKYCCEYDSEDTECACNERLAVLKIPTADVAQVRHGRWVAPHWRNGDYCYNCSKCGGEAMHREYQWAINGIYPICPNCGAKMDGGADNG